MYDIHLIEKSAGYRRAENTTDEWITEGWHVSEDTAKQLIGGTVFLHTLQKGGCYLGGEILGYEFITPKRIAIHFRFDKAVVNQIATEGWSQEMLLVKRDEKAA